MKDSCTTKSKKLPPSNYKVRYLNLEHQKKSQKNRKTQTIMPLKVAILQKKTRWKNPKKKLSIEKAKSIRVEAEAIEKAKEKLDISLGNIEKDRENLEKDREAAVQPSKS